MTMLTRIQAWHPFAWEDTQANDVDVLKLPTKFLHSIGTRFVGNVKKRIFLPTHLHINLQKEDSL